MSHLNFCEFNRERAVLKMTLKLPILIDYRTSKPDYVRRVLVPDMILCSIYQLAILSN